MNARLALPVIAAVIAMMPATFSLSPQNATYNGDTYTTIGNCIYDGDGNLTECYTD